MKDVRLSGYIPGAIGRISELHGKYYHEHWGFDLFFEQRGFERLQVMRCYRREGFVSEFEFDMSLVPAPVVLGVLFSGAQPLVIGFPRFFHGQSVFAAAG